MLQLQQAFLIGHKDGFKNALRQLGLFTPNINLEKFNVLKDVKDEELVRESQMESSEEASNNEMISKADDVEATSNFVLPLNPLMT